MRQAIFRFLGRPVHLHARLPFSTTVYLTVTTPIRNWQVLFIGGYLEIYNLRNVDVMAGVGLLSVELGYFKRTIKGAC